MRTWQLALFPSVTTAITYTFPNATRSFATLGVAAETFSTASTDASTVTVLSNSAGRAFLGKSARTPMRTVRPW